MDEQEREAYERGKLKATIENVVKLMEEGRTRFTNLEKEIIRLKESRSKIIGALLVINLAWPAFLILVQTFLKK